MPRRYKLAEIRVGDLVFDPRAGKLCCVVTKIGSMTDDQLNLCIDATGFTGGNLLQITLDMGALVFYSEDSLAALIYG